MPAFITRAIAHRVAGSAHKQGWFDVRGGLALMRDPQVRASTKLLSLGLGLLLTCVLEICQIPLEAVLGVFLPFIGWGLELMVDGIEFVALPLVFGAIILRWKVGAVPGA